MPLYYKGAQLQIIIDFKSLQEWIICVKQWGNFVVNLWFDTAAIVCIDLWEILFDTDDMFWIQTLPPLINSQDNSISVGLRSLRSIAMCD